MAWLFRMAWPGMKRANWGEPVRAFCLSRGSLLMWPPGCRDEGLNFVVTIRRIRY